MDAVLQHFESARLVNMTEGLSTRVYNVLEIFQRFLNGKVAMSGTNADYADVTVTDVETGKEVYKFHGEPAIATGNVVSVTDRMPVGKSEFVNMFRVTYKDDVTYEYMFHNFTINHDDFETAQFMYLLTIQLILEYQAADITHELKKFVTKFDAVPVMQVESTRRSVPPVSVKAIDGGHQTFTIEDLLANKARK